MSVRRIWLAGLLVCLASAALAQERTSISLVNGDIEADHVELAMTQMVLRGSVVVKLKQDDLQGQVTADQVTVNLAPVPKSQARPGTFQIGALQTIVAEGNATYDLTGIDAAAGITRHVFGEAEALNYVDATKVLTLMPTPGEPVVVNMVQETQPTATNGLTEPAMQEWRITARQRMTIAFVDDPNSTTFQATATTSAADTE